MGSGQWAVGKLSNWILHCSHSPLPTAHSRNHDALYSEFGRRA